MRYPRRDSWLLLGVLVMQGAALLWIAWDTGPGWDEWGHLPSGLFSLQYGDYSPYCVNPPLTRLWCALPVWLAGGGIRYEPIPRLPGFRSEGFLGLAYIEQHGPRVFTWISLARTAAIPIAIMGTVLIWGVARRFFTRQAAITAAVLWAFSPMVLTFGASITPDITAAVVGLWVAWTFYVWLKIGTTSTAARLGLACGFALLSKATWLILLPLLVTWAVIHGLWRWSRTRWYPRIRQALLAMIVCWVVVNGMYEFQGSLKPLKEFQFVSEALGGVRNASTTVTEQFGNRFRGSWLGNLPVPLPADYVRGIDIQKRDFEVQMPSYFLGQWKNGGWWYYYALGIWLKEPVAFWFLASIAACTGFWRMRTSLNRRLIFDRCVIFVPGIAVLLFVSSQTGFNHHLRYVLPFLPALYLLVAAATGYLTGWRAQAVRLLLVWYVISSVSVLPRSYSYFTEAVGGSRHGWKYLGDSNLDWGQDILTAQRWVRNNPDKRPVYLLYSVPLIDFQKLGIDAADGHKHIGPDGPLRDGWWIVFSRTMLEPQYAFFRSWKPAEVLSATTWVFHVENGKAVEYASFDRE